MKILLINKFFYQKGGSETVFFTTKKLLEKAGNQVIVFSMKDLRNKPSKFEKYFVENIDFNKKQGLFKSLKKAAHYIYSVEARNKIKKLIKEHKPDIAHLHNISHQITPSILSVLKKNKIPVVQTLHDYQLICPNYRLFTQGKICERCQRMKFYNAIRYKCVRNSYLASWLACTELYLQRILKFYLPKVDLFVATSQFLHDKLKQWGIKQPLQVVNNSLAVDDLQPSFEPGKFLLCVSRFSQEKGLFTLIKAVKDLPKVKLKIVGDGPLFNQVKIFIAKNNLENIELVGYQPLSQVYKIMRDCKLLVIPSEWHENYPMVVLEAMALAKPVLASDLGGLIEMIEDNETGWHFQAGNTKALKEKINNLYWQDDLLIKAGKKARKQVEKNNSNEKYLQQLLRIYDKLANPGAELG